MAIESHSPIERMNSTLPEAIDGDSVPKTAIWRIHHGAITRTNAATAPTARRIFDAALWRKDQPLRVVLIGTDFEVRVWERLLDIPMGKLTTYSDLAARAGAPKAARAVGAAVGKNPICFVVPCHRVIGKSGELTGYHWGITRKRAMLGWEAGMSAAA